MMGLRRIVTLLVAATVLTLGASASASHYFIVDIADRFSPTALAEFERFGLRDTEDVLRNVDTREDRESLASVTGISADELYQIAVMCEMLQIEGIGPRAYDLLTHSGVQNVADLAGREAASLLAELEVVNSMHHLTGVNPPLDLVAAWIELAAGVPIRIEH